MSAAHRATPDCLPIFRRRSGCSATGGEEVVLDLVIVDLSLVFEGVRSCRRGDGVCTLSPRHVRIVSANM
jgi:hypothetical protein